MVTEQTQLTLCADVRGLTHKRPAWPPGYVVRPIEEADLERVAELYLAAYPADIVANDEEALAEMRETFEGAYGRLDHAASPVVMHDEIVVGSVMVVEDAPWPDTPRGPFVIEVIVHPSHRRKGLAQSALRWSAGRLLDNGARAVALRVMSDNPARLLYQELGFTMWAG